MSTSFVDHLVFRVPDVERTERFYTALLGPPHDRAQDSVAYRVGSCLIFFTLCDQCGPTPYRKEEIGLNHLAFGVRSLRTLERIREHLDSAGIGNSGIRIDRYGHREFIWLDDPDGMRVEFYLRPRPTRARTR